MGGILREEYYVWDKEASINFIKPGGQSDLFAEFEVTEGMLENIYQMTRNGEKCFPEFITHVKDKQGGNVVSEVQRKLYVRKKPQYREEEVLTDAVWQYIQKDLQVEVFASFNLISLLAQLNTSLHRSV